MNNKKKMIKEKRRKEKRNDDEGILNPTKLIQHAASLLEFLVNKILLLN